MPVWGDTEDQRWERAHRLAAGQRDAAVRRALRVRLGLLVGVCTFVGVAAGLAGAFFGSRSHRVRHVPHHHVSHVQLIVGIVFSIAGFGLMGFGVVRTIRRGMAGRLLDSPLLALKYSERRAVVRQVLGKRTARADQLDITRNVAGRLLAQQPSMILFVGIAIFFVGKAISNPAPARFAMAVVYPLLAAALAPATRRQRRKAGTFLEHNPAPTANAPT